MCTLYSRCQLLQVFPICQQWLASVQRFVKHDCTQGCATVHRPGNTLKNIKKHYPKHSTHDCLVFLFMFPMQPRNLSGIAARQQKQFLRAAKNIYAGRNIGDVNPGVQESFCVQPFTSAIQSHDFIPPLLTAQRSLTESDHLGRLYVGIMFNVVSLHVGHLCENIVIYFHCLEQAEQCFYTQFPSGCYTSFRMSNNYMNGGGKTEEMGFLRVCEPWKWL